jgi:predicted ATPase
MAATEELDSISIEGFKSLASLTVELEPINVLIGPNGSGKSNFIEVFSFLHEICEGRLQEYVRRAGGAEALLHFGSRSTRTIRLRLSFQEGVNQYELSLSPTDDDSLYPAFETAFFWNKQTYPDEPFGTGLTPRQKGREAGISNPAPSGVARFVRRHLDSFRVYHLHDTSTSAPMRKTAQINDNAFLRPDGSNLPAFLYLLQEKHPDAYGLIRRTVQRVAPFFDDFVLRPDPLNDETIRLAWKHKASDQYFGAASLSDGSLRFIALTTLFFQPKRYRPSVILVDEPELGLHPYAITLLASLVKQASTETQVILSTQSSLLLDHFRPDDVLVAELAEHATRLTRLEPARLAAWLEDYSLGQLWEKNEIGGRPGSG